MEDTSTVEKRINADKLLLLEHLRKTPIVEMACSKANIGRTSYYRWRKEDPQFAKDADDALSDGSLLMNDVAEGYLISAIKDKNIAAISLYLKTHHPAYSSKLEINGTIKQTVEELNDEQQLVVKEALRLASIIKKRNISKLTAIDYENK